MRMCGRRSMEAFQDSERSTEETRIGSRACYCEVQNAPGVAVAPEAAVDAISRVLGSSSRRTNLSLSTTGHAASRVISLCSDHADLRY